MKLNYVYKLNQKVATCTLCQVCGTFGGSINSREETQQIWFCLFEQSQSVLLWRQAGYATGLARFKKDPFTTPFSFVKVS